VRILLKNLRAAVCEAADLPENSEFHVLLQGRDGGPAVCAGSFSRIK